MMHGLPGSDVLLVEDDPTLGAVIQEALTLEGLHVERLSNGFAALQRMEQQVPALLILDIGLAGLRGDSLGVGLRSSWPPDKLPILLISALPDREVDEATRAIQPYAVLHKPFELEAFIDRVAAGLRLSSRG